MVQENDIQEASAAVYGVSRISGEGKDRSLPEGGSIPWKCVAAGNDMIMPGSPRDDENIREAYEKGYLSEKDIRACAGRIFAAMKKLGMDI